MDTTNQRYNERDECFLTGKMVIAGKSRSIDIADISRTGARIISGLNLTPNQETEIEINITDSMVFKSDCRVVWSTTHLSGYMAGIIYINIDEEKIARIFSQANLIRQRKIELKKSPHKEIYDSVFESYTEEIFLRRVEEFVTYIKKNDPKKGPWAEQLYKKLKDTIAKTMNEFEKWAE